MNSTTRRLWTLLGFAGAALVGGASAKPITAAPHFRTTGPCIVSPDVPTDLDGFVRRVIGTPDLSWLRTKAALIPVDTSLIALSTDTVICRLAAEAARRYYVGADTGTLSPVSVVTADTSQMVVVTMRELYRNSRPRPGGDTISAGFQAVSLLTLNSSYTVVSKWSWLR